jgi:hypothetical protein
MGGVNEDPGYWVVALSLVATPTCDASAAGYSKAQKRYAKRQVPSASPGVGYRPTYPDASDGIPVTRTSYRLDHPFDGTKCDAKDVRGEADPPHKVGS